MRYFKPKKSIIFGLSALLVSMGVDKDAAAGRIQTMNGDELARLQQNFNQLPAGAGGVETGILI